MSYREILVHLDSDKHCETRLAIAAAVTSTFAATLIGLYGESDPHVMSSAARDPAAALGGIAARLEASFRRQTEDTGIASKWTVAMTVNDMELTKRLLFATHHVDLVVLGQYRAGESTASVPPDLVEQIVLNSGRPVLCIPAVDRVASVGKRIMVAWNASREATRAIHDALPFLVRAEHIRLVAINPDVSRKAYGEEPFLPIQRHLALHDVVVHCETLWVEDSDIVERVWSRIADESIDMLVMGAHSQYGFPYLHRGGITREVLRSMMIPVLMSH